MAIRRPRRNSRLNRRPYTAGSSSGESILGAPDTTDLGDWSDGSDSGSSSSGSTYDGGSSSYDSGSSSSSSSGGSDYGSF